MQARITLTMGQRSVVAELKDDLTWSCEDQLIEAFFNSTYAHEALDGTGPVGLVRRAARTAEQAGWEVQVKLCAAAQDAA